MMRRNGLMSNNEGRKDNGTFTSQADEAFFAAIGRLVISWAHLELGLDCMVHILYHGFRGNTIEPELPRNLQRKVTFLRTSFKKMPIGTEAVQGYVKLLNRIQTASEMRHDIIHGAVIEQADRPGEAIMVRVIRGRSDLDKRKVRVTTVDVLKAAMEAQDLGSRVLYWVDETNDMIKRNSIKYHQTS